MNQNSESKNSLLLRSELTVFSLFADNLRLLLQPSRPAPAFSFPRMGNANTVQKHVATAEKTGACQLAKLGLAEVRHCGPVT